MFKKSAAPAAAASGYTIAKSLRFRGSASASLTRTPSVTGNQRTFTWSGWVKRGTLGVANTIFDADYGNNGRYTLFYFTSSDTLRLFGGVYSTGASTTTSVELITTQVFRDPSAWYHIVLAVDTTQATSSNRVKLYINGVQVTSFSTSTYPAQNDQTYYNVNTTGMSIGSDSFQGFTFDGYMAEVNFIDGQQLTPSSFGSTNSTTGVWQPIAYTGTYGTNGFYLKFTDTSSTAALGTDYSGNSNTWTVNNISLTTGSTYDSMTDVPTLTSSTVANYAVMNPISNPNNPLFTISDGNLSYSCSASAGNGPRMCLIASVGVTTGKWYWEVKEGSPANSYLGVNTGFVAGGTGNGVYYANTGGGSTGASTATYSGTALNLANGDIAGFAFDADALTLSVYKNNTLQGTFSGLESGKTWFPDFTVYTAASSTAFTTNFGQQGFTYTPPTGYKALNTYNLPSSTISNGRTVFDATIYTANGSTNAISNADSGTTGFKPDFVWTKSRTDAYSHELYDSVRGITKVLVSNATNAESTDANGLLSLNSNGFTLGYNNGSNYINGSAGVTWNWQAGQGTTSSNTNGSITSTVSVNANAGFSVVTYTGTGSAATVGHGLGVAPKMIIVKARNAAENWLVYNSNLLTPATDYLILNSAAASGTFSGYWNGGANSSTFGVGGFSAINGNGNTYVAYCWSEIAGFSKFGSYTGNGSSDGPFIYTGFRPKFVLIKQTSYTTDWDLGDSTRSPYNQATATLYPNTGGAETTIYDLRDYLSNGFKIRTSDGNTNTNGNTYIYAAFAENPFKNALAR